MEAKNNYSLVYRNDFNVVPLPELKAREMDFFMKIFYELYNKPNDKRELCLKAEDFFANVKKTNSYYQLKSMFKTFANKVLGYNLTFEEKERLTAFVCFEKCVWDLKTNEIIIIAQKDFYELLLDKKKPYARLDLEEFWDLTCEYAKRLYPYLKQFRFEGLLVMKWDDFREKLHIPKHYKSDQIDKWVLRRLMKDLLKERNLFSGDRVIFKDLKFEKLYRKGRGRGGKVIDRIKFEFAKEKPLKKVVAESNESEMLKRWRQGAFDSYKFKYTKPHPEFDKFGVFKIVGDYEITEPEKALIAQFQSVDNPFIRQNMTFKSVKRFKEVFNDFEIVE